MGKDAMKRKRHAPTQLSDLFQLDEIAVTCAVVIISCCFVIDLSNYYYTQKGAAAGGETNKCATGILSGVSNTMPG